MKYWLIILGMVGLTGCARFETHPLVPAQTAAQLESRRLDDAGLRVFLEQNLGHKLEVWPLPEWDLNTLTLAAFYYHPSLEVARAQWAVARAAIKTAKGRPNPSITVTPGYDTTTAIPSPWIPMLNFDWPLETAGKRDKRIAEARELAESARWDIVTTAWRVRASVRDSLLDWRVAEDRGALLDQQYDRQQQIANRLQQRVEAGDAARSELTTAQIALHKTRLDQWDARAKSSDARARLAGALGLGTEALAGVRLVCEPAATPPPILNSPAARQLALTGRADLLGALADYAAAEDDLQLEIAKQYPDVHFSPGYQFNQGDNQWTLGLTVELPLLNQNQGPIAAAKARRQLAAAQFTALQSRIIGDLDRALAADQLAEQSLASGETLLTAEREQENSVHAQQQAGAADQFDLLNAQLEQINARLVQQEGRAQVQRTRDALEDALQHPLDSATVSALQHLSATPHPKKLHP
jgi:outer membrane protein TolC